MSMSPEDELMLLKDLTKKTDLVYDGQVLQLKMWGSLIFEPKTFSIGIDAENKLIQYRYKETGPSYRLDSDRRLVEIAKSIKWMLGDTWKIELIKGKKSLGFLSTELKVKEHAKTANGRRNRTRRSKTNKKRARATSKVHK